MVQGKILVLPPMRPGNSDGSGELPAHPDTAPLALPQPKDAAKVPAKQSNLCYE